MAAPLDDLIVGAKKEGALEFYAPLSITPEGAAELGAAFNKTYALSTTLHCHPSGAKKEWRTWRESGTGAHEAALDAGNGTGD